MHSSLPLLVCWLFCSPRSSLLTVGDNRRFGIPINNHKHDLIQAFFRPFQTATSSETGSTFKTFSLYFSALSPLRIYLSPLKSGFLCMHLVQKCMRDLRISSRWSSVDRHLFLFFIQLRGTTFEPVPKSITPLARYRESPLRALNTVAGISSKQQHSKNFFSHPPCFLPINPHAKNDSLL